MSSAMLGLCMALLRCLWQHPQSVVRPHTAACLQDSEDDVCAVSAEALLPVAHLLARQSGNVIDSLTSALWDALLEVDELNPSTGDHR